MPNALLARSLILERLSTRTRAGVLRLEVSPVATSTQVLALEAPVPRDGCAVFIADEQTAGQGRRGRNWVSPPASNLYMSVSRRFDLSLPALSGLSLVVGLVVVEALQGLGFAGIAVKWPNDIMVGDRKLGGVLIDVRADAQATAVVIGIGINVSMPPETGATVDQPWCDLSMLSGPPVSRDLLAAAILDVLLPALEEFATQGWPAFAVRWQHYDLLAGKSVRILEGARAHEGLAMGVDASGALRVRMDSGEHCFRGGEVSVRAA